MHPLDGCRAKIRRARLHVEEFREGVQIFTTHAPYSPRGVVSEATNEAVFTVESNPNFAAVPLDLPLLAGEVTHQLRSALDHLVWQLVLGNTGQPPPGTRSGFPIFWTEAGYNDRAPAMIAGVSANAATRIRAAQPFLAGADAKRVSTWLVHELNNTDKHRVIPIAVACSFVGHIRMTKADGSSFDIVPPQEEVGELLHDGLEIARVALPEGSEGAMFDVRIGLDIAFEQLGALTRHPATQLLTEATDYVSDLVESLRGEFPD